MTKYGSTSSFGMPWVVKSQFGEHRCEDWGDSVPSEPLYYRGNIDDRLIVS